MKPININIAYWINQTDLIKFIEQNSNMDWNEVCDYVHKYIFGETSSLYSSIEFEELDEEGLLYNKETSK